MRAITLIILSIFYSLNLQANNYIENYTSESFFDSGLSERNIDPNNIDLELLEATLFFTINQKRDRKRKNAFKLNTDLTEVCFKLLLEYNGASIKGSVQRKKRIHKNYQEKLKQSSFRGKYLDYAFGFFPVLDYKKGKRYYYKPDEENADIHPFYSKTGNGNFQLLPTLSYQSLAEKIFRISSKLLERTSISTKAFTDLGIAIQAHQSSEKRIPHIKVFWTLGGHRTAGFSL